MAIHRTNVEVNIRQPAADVPTPPPPAPASGDTNTTPDPFKPIQ